MTKLFLTMAVLLISSMVYSQDKLYTHKGGDSIICKVIEVGEKSIKYKYQNEDLTNSITKNLVSEIQFSSGRIQKVTEKIIINGEKDWEKVQLTRIESDVEGLTRVGEMMAKASGTAVTGQGKLEEKAMNRLKKEAAAKGCHIVLILTTTGNGGRTGMGGSAARASMTGVSYKY